MRCRICNKDSHKVKERSTYSEVKCEHCGSYSFYFSEEYQYTMNNAKYGSDEYVEDYELRWAHLNIPEYLSMDENIHEVGCFNGQFVDHLQKKGFRKVTGSDINQGALDYGRRKYNLSSSVLRSEVSRANTYIMIDVLEHMSEPIEFLKSCKLNGGKRFLISVPNAKRILFDKSDFPPHHYSRFSVQGFQEISDALNMKVTLVKYEYNALLLVRNFVGRLIYGWSKRYFIGSPAFKVNDGILRNLYFLINKPASLFLRLLRIPYASIIVVIE